MTERVIIAGSGGQGIMLVGKVLAEAAMREVQHVTWFPSYGAEVRGGTAHCMVVISDEEIGSPYIEKADTLIIMNEPFLERFKNRVRTKGLLILNSSLISKKHGTKNVALSYPFTDAAVGLGNIKVANIIALGFFIAAKNIVRADTVLGVIQDFAPPDKRDIAEINKKALEEGLHAVQSGTQGDS